MGTLVKSEVSPHDLAKSTLEDENEQVKIERPAERENDVAAEKKDNVTNDHPNSSTCTETGGTTEVKENAPKQGKCYLLSSRHFSYLNK